MDYGKAGNECWVNFDWNTEEPSFIVLGKYFSITGRFLINSDIILFI